MNFFLTVVVENVQTEQIDEHSIIVMWNELDIPGSTVVNYTVYYSSLSDTVTTRTTTVPDDSTQEFPPNVTHGIFRELDSNHRYQFQVTATVEVAGYIVESKKSAVTDYSVVTIAPVPPSANTICLKPASLGGVVVGIFAFTTFIFLVAFLIVTCIVKRGKGKVYNTVAA